MILTAELYVTLCLEKKESNAIKWLTLPIKRYHHPRIQWFMMPYELHRIREPDALTSKGIRGDDGKSHPWRHSDGAAIESLNLPGTCAGRWAEDGWSSASSKLFDSACVMQVRSKDLQCTIFQTSRASYDLWIQEGKKTNLCIFTYHHLLIGSHWFVTFWPTTISPYRNRCLAGWSWRSLTSAPCPYRLWTATWAKVSKAKPREHVRTWDGYEPWPNPYSIKYQNITD